MASSSTPTVKVVSTVPDLEAFLSSITPSSTLYLDLEGQKLSRFGTLTLITILVHPQQQVSIIDVQTLGHAAFSTPESSPSQTLHSVLSSPTIPKCFWDVRNDADALWANYGVALSGVTDIQLLENATRFSGSKKYLRGLASCVQHDLVLGAAETARWAAVKKDVTARMAAGVFDARPLAPETVAYCAGDVQHLPRLRDAYLRRAACTRGRLAAVVRESERRVSEARKPEYQPHGPSKALAPWGEKGI